MPPFIPEVAFIWADVENDSMPVNSSAQRKTAEFFMRMPFLKGDEFENVSFM
jgi:hypothetical protein